LQQGPRAELQESSTMKGLQIIPLHFFAFLTAVCCECQLKENAGELISVGYFNTSSDFTYVDVIAVRMRESRRKFGSLVFNEDCSEKTKKTKLKASVYKEEKSELVDEKEQRAELKFEHLDPCSVYKVNVTIGQHKVGTYTVGPYYTQDDVQHPFLSSEENPEYKNSKGQIKMVTAYKDKAVIELGPVCARRVMLHLREKQSKKTTHHWDLEKTTITNVTERITPRKESSTQLVFENLQPCTQYTVDIELWLDDKRSPTEKGDFKKDHIFDFYTMPDYKDNLTSRQRHLVVVKSKDEAGMPKECSIEDNPSLISINSAQLSESQILQITIGISLLVVLSATILACSLTFWQRQQRGQLEMKKLLPDDSPSLISKSSPVFTTILPIEPDPETDEQTVVLLKYADLSKIY